MRISAKGRYGLAAMIAIAQGDFKGDYVPVVMIADKLGLSKIYLEQVFSLLKRAELVHSVKGAQGGYRLTRSPDTITAWDILSALEQLLFENTEESVKSAAPGIEHTMQSKVFVPLDTALADCLKAVTLDTLVSEADGFLGSDRLMFFI